MGELNHKARIIRAEIAPLWFVLCDFMVKLKARGEISSGKANLRMM
jgi:hypothetical protein